jgi:hypothetical protein
LQLLIGYNLSSWTGFEERQIAMNLPLWSGPDQLTGTAPLPCASAPKADADAPGSYQSKP